MWNYGVCGVDFDMELLRSYGSYFEILELLGVLFLFYFVFSGDIWRSFCYKPVEWSNVYMYEYEKSNSS